MRAAGADDGARHPAVVGSPASAAHQPQRIAETPVMSRPAMSVFTSNVPSYV